MRERAEADRLRAATDAERMVEAINWWGAETRFAPPPGGDMDSPAEEWVPDGLENRINEAVLTLLEAVYENAWACMSCMAFRDNGAAEKCPEHAAVDALVEVTLNG